MTVREEWKAQMRSDHPQIESQDIDRAVNSLVEAIMSAPVTMKERYEHFRSKGLSEADLNKTIEMYETLKREELQ